MLKTSKTKNTSTSLFRAPAIGLLMLLVTGCSQALVNSPMDRMQASNDRDWAPEFGRVPNVSLRDDGVMQLNNIRNFNWVTAEDFVVEYYDHEFLLEDIQSVDFIVVPFNNAPLLAHTMLSFGMSDGRWLAISIETRREAGEKYSAILGAGRQFELIYIVADERDLIRLRTRHRDSDVYVYPTIATPRQAQQLFVDVMDRANKLAAEPEFYHSVSNNCTTNLAAHVNTVADDRILYNWKVLLPGFSAQYAYDLGLLPQEIPFEDLQALSLVNELAEDHYDDPDFSFRIRSGRERINRLIERQQQRNPVLNARGAQYLESQNPRQAGRSGNSGMIFGRPLFERLRR
ncbi:MAG: DUF4105 domain-containing protein [Planctomycetota bacterium]